MSCKKCIHSKWIGVDGYGYYCSNPNKKGLILCENVEKCDFKQLNIILKLDKL